MGERRRRAEWSFIFSLGSSIGGMVGKGSHR